MISMNLWGTLKMQHELLAAAFVSNRGGSEIFLAHQVQAILVHPPDFCGMIGFFIFYRVASQFTSLDHDFLGSIV